MRHDVALAASISDLKRTLKVSAKAANWRGGGVRGTTRGGRVAQSVGAVGKNRRRGKNSCSTNASSEDQRTTSIGIRSGGEMSAGRWRKTFGRGASGLRVLTERQEIAACLCSLVWGNPHKAHPWVR